MSDLPAIGGGRGDGAVINHHYKDGKPELPLMGIDVCFVPIVLTLY